MTDLSKSFNPPMWWDSDWRIWLHLLQGKNSCATCTAWTEGPSPHCCHKPGVYIKLFAKSHIAEQAHQLSKSEKLDSKRIPLLLPKDASNWKESQIKFCFWAYWKHPGPNNDIQQDSLFLHEHKSTFTTNLTSGNHPLNMPTSWSVASWKTHHT